MASLLKLTNNAIGRLNASITTSSTTIQLVPGQGAKFPSLGAGEFFPCTLLAADGTLEIVKVTARSGDNLTVLRGQEGTAASAFAISDRCELRMTAGALQGEIDRLAGIADGYASAIAGKQPAGPYLTTSTGVALGADNYGEGTRLQSGAPSNIASLGLGTPNVNKVPLIIGNNNNPFASAVVQFLRGGQYAGFFGLDTDNKWKVGGYSMGLVAYELYHQGNFNPASYAPLAGATFTGNVAAPLFTATSDERKKTNWAPFTDALLDRVADMAQSGFFDWLDGSGTSLGGSAQELRAIGLEAAVYEDADGNLSVNYGGLTFAIVQAMLRRDKVSKADIERRLAALEAK